MLTIRPQHTAGPSANRLQALRSFGVGRDQHLIDLASDPTCGLLIRDFFEQGLTNAVHGYPMASTGGSFRVL